MHEEPAWSKFMFLFPESGGISSGREVQRLKKRNLQLEEENNLLKLKIETLLDMVRPASLSGSYKWKMEVQILQ